MRGELARPAVLLWLGMFLFSLVPRAEACGRPPDDWNSKQRIAEAHERATTIVVAKLARSSRTSSVGNLRDIGIVEDASFVVVEVLKGPHDVGETIHTRTEFVAGPCGTNVLNDPPWIHTTDETTKDLVPLAISDTWLIFGGKEQPYDLSLGRSSPMNVQGDRVRNSLREILAEADASATLREFRKTLQEARSAPADAAPPNCPHRLSDMVGLSKSSLFSELESPDLEEDVIARDSERIVFTHYMHYDLRPLQAKSPAERFPTVTFELTSSNVVRAVSCK